MGDVIWQEELTGDLVTREADPEVQLQLPPMYKVMLLNDDFTPMEFVVFVLQNFFRMNQEQAVKIMLEVHNTGQGICGVFTRDIAETKVIQVNDFARSQQYPLLCVMEPE